MTPRQSCVSSQLPADREDRENLSQARALWCAERVGRQSLLGLGEAEASGSGECPTLRWGCHCLDSSYFEPYSESSGTREDWGSGGGGTIHGSHPSDRIGFFYIIIINNNGLGVEPGYGGVYFNSVGVESGPLRSQPVFSIMSSPHHLHHGGWCCLSQ